MIQRAGRGVQRYSWVVVALLATAIVGCTVKKPQVPSTNFTISIPVANDRTTIEKVAGDRSDFLRLDDEGLLTLDFASEFNQREEIGQRLRVRPTSSTFSTPIGTINLPGQDLPGFSISLSTLLAQDIESGSTVPLIPSTDFSVSEDLPGLVGVRSLTVGEGGLEIVMSNGFPVSLTNVSLMLSDRGDAALGISSGPIDVLDLGTIDPGNTGGGTFDLAGKTISSNLAIDVTGLTTQGTNVAVEDGAELAISASLSDLELSQAFAILPQQEFSDNQVLAFPDDRIQVTRAIIDNGGLTFNVINEIEVVMEIELRLDDLRKANGETNVFVIDALTPGQTRTVQFDLNDNIFAPANPLELALSYTVRTVDSGEPVQLFSEGEIRIETVTEDLVFGSVQGILNKIELPVESVTREVEFPEGLDKVALGATSLNVQLTSAVGFRSRIDLAIDGTNSKGESASILISEVFQRGDPDAPVVINLSPPSDELTDFLNLLPTSITVTPVVLLGDGEGVETIEQDHWVQVDKVEFMAPARFEILEETRIEPDPIRREFTDDSARDRISANLDSATVITAIDNWLPIGVRVSLRVAPNIADVYSTDESLFTNNQENGYLRIPKTGFFEVGAGIVGADGRVTEGTTNQQQISLEDEDVLVFLRDGGFYTGVLVELDATGDQVELYGSDFINVEAATQIFMELNEDLVE
ncbi:MAG: hypothetical protein ACI906_000594 [Candidatus Latescibacterota bacterium]|jgi:hypothetical protein